MVILHNVRIQTIFFDLDGTLYPDVKGGVWDAMRGRIEMYMHEKVGIPKSQVAAQRESYLGRFGTTLRGLITDYQIDPDDYLLYVHDVPVEQLISPNRKLTSLLAGLPQRKWVFTNSSLEHSRRVLAALGIAEHFEGIVDIKTMSYRSKPESRSYVMALQKAGLESAQVSLFIDDQEANLEPAKRLGAGTVLVGTREPYPAADRSIAAVEELLLAMPGLME